MTSYARAALGVVGWLLSYGYVFAFAGPAMTPCTQGSDDAWVIVLTLYTPALLVGCLLVAQARDHARWLRFGALPHVLTLAAAVEVLPSHFAPATLGGRHLCDVKVLPESYGVAAPWWHALYWPLQVTLLLCLVAFILWFARLPGRAPAPERA